MTSFYVPKWQDGTQCTVSGAVRLQCAYSFCYTYTTHRQLDITLRNVTGSTKQEKHEKIILIIF